MTQQDDFEKEANGIGERLAILLVASTLPDDVKAGFASMIPEMTPEQLDRLIKILETNVLDTATTQERELGQAVQEAQKSYEKDRQEAEKKALADLEAIEHILNQENQ